MAKKTVLALIGMSLGVTSCLSGAAVGQRQTIAGEIDREGGALVQHPIGLTVVVPPGAVWGDSTVLTVGTARKPSALSGTISVPGIAFEVQHSEDFLFARALEIAIPYDPGLLPEDRTEGEVFAVFWSRGEWIRVPGQVDQAANKIAVRTLHNGLWSWGFETSPNIDDDMAVWVQELAQAAPEFLSELRAEEQRRREELDGAWEALLTQVDEIEQVQEPLERPLVMLFNAGPDVLASDPVQEMIGRWGPFTRSGGAYFAFKIGSKVVATLSTLSSTWQLYKWEAAWVEGLYLRQQLEVAHLRWRESACLLFLAENPGAVTGPPDCGESVAGIKLAWESASGDQTLGIAGFSALPEGDLFGLTDLRTAVIQGDRALHSNTLSDWLLLIDPSLPYEQRTNRARLLTEEVSGYKFSCLGMHPGPAENLSDAALLIYRASGGQPRSDRIFRFLVGRPSTSPFYRFQPYFQPWQEWDPSYWEGVKDQTTPCLGEGAGEVAGYDLTDLESFKLALKFALETAEFDLLLRLIGPSLSIWESDTTPPTAYSPDEAIELLKSWDIVPGVVTVDLLDRGRAIVDGVGCNVMFPGNQVYSEGWPIGSGQVFLGLYQADTVADGDVPSGPYHWGEIVPRSLVPDCGSTSAIGGPVCPESYLATGDAFWVSWADEGIYADLEDRGHPERQIDFIPHSGIDATLLDGPVCIPAEEGWGDFYVAGGWREGWMVEYYDYDLGGTSQGWVVASLSPLLPPEYLAFVGQVIHVSGNFYDSPGGANRYTEDDVRVMLTGEPLVQDEPRAGWEDVWWPIEYAGDSAWINVDLTGGIDDAQDGVFYNCDMVGNAFWCNEGHRVIYSR
jgi:hypothetical protein